MTEDNNSNKAHPQGNIFILEVCYFREFSALYATR